MYLVTYFSSEHDTSHVVDILDFVTIDSLEDFIKQSIPDYTLMIADYFQCTADDVIVSIEKCNHYEHDNYMTYGFNICFDYASLSCHLSFMPYKRNSFSTYHGAASFLNR